MTLGWVDCAYCAEGVDDVGVDDVGFGVVCVVTVVTPVLVTELAPSFVAFVAVDLVLVIVGDVVVALSVAGGKDGDEDEVEMDGEAANGFSVMASTTFTCT